MTDDSRWHTKQRILVIDDNEATVAILVHILKQEGYQVLSAFSGEAALSLIEEKGLPHLAIVDYHMAPGMSGFEFCQTIHQFCDLPVIMLTADHNEAIVVDGLSHYVEDFVHKPVSPAVLLTRVQRVLHSLGSFGTSQFTPIDDRLAVNFPAKQALVNGNLVSLTPIETKLLYVLLRRAGQPVNTDYILRRVWPQEMAFEDRLHVHVHRLRRKIEDDKRSTPYIISKRGRGYIFQAN